MIKVLQVFGALVLGGAESRVMDIYRNMDPAECQFDFVSMKQENQYYEDEIKCLGGNIYKIGFPRDVGIIKNISELRNCIRQGKYDAVHAHTSYHCGIVMLAAWLEKVPVRVSHARTNGSRQVGIKTKIANYIGRILISLFSTKKIAISNAAGEYLFGKDKYEVIPNAIDVPKYQLTDKNEIDKYKQTLGIAHDNMVIGHIGRCDHMKNHEFVISCFHAFHQSHPNSTLVLVGDGELKDSMLSLTRELGIESDVLFLGERNDVPDLIHIFDVLLFPSIFEGLGGVVIESQAAGIPVVESDNIPNEADLGVGLVKKVSLSDSVSKWIKALEDSRMIHISYDVINKALSVQGYDLRMICDRYIRIYRGLE